MSAKPAYRTEWCKSVVASSLSPHARLVALVLGVYMNVDGLCWPSIRTIASASGFQERAVRKLISEVEASGLLIADRRGGKGRPSLYQAHIPGTVVPPLPQYPARRRIKGGTPTTHTGHPGAPEVVGSHQEKGREGNFNTEQTNCHYPNGKRRHKPSEECQPECFVDAPRSVDVEIAVGEPEEVPS